MSRARTKLEPGERLLLAARPHPAALLPALLRALGVVLAAAVVLALLAHSSAPDAVRIALDLLVLGVAARAVFRFTRAVWQWDRSLLALTTRRVFVVAPRGAVRRAWETMPLGRRSTAPASAQLRRAPARLRDAHARRRAAAAATCASSATPSASPRRSSTPSPHDGRTWTQIEGPAVSDQPAPRSRLA